MIVINGNAAPEEKDYYHLQPVVDYLLSKGNVSHNDFLWGNNRTGYFCHLEKGIDFDDLLSAFEFPYTIKINKKAHLNNIYIAITLSEKYSIVRITDDAKRAL